MKGVEKMHTLTATPPPNEISYRHIPNWMIPQLSFLRDRLGIVVTNITRDYPQSDSNSAVIRAYLPSERVYYLFRIYKADMRHPNQVPPMFEVL